MKMRTTSLLFLGCSVLWAQAPAGPQFEVASIHPTPPSVTHEHVGISGGPGTSDPTQITYRYQNLRNLVFWAYEAKSYQFDMPAWMSDAYFDIAAKVPPGATKSDVTVMLRNLLIERFHLKVHHEERETQAYILTIGKNGPTMPAYPMELPDGAADGVIPKFKGYDKDGFLIAPPGAVTSLIMHNGGQTRINSFREPIRILCSALSNILKAPTVDQTGLTGRYDIRLRFAEDAGPPADSAAASDPAPTVFSAVQTQLGLKLEPKKLRLDFLVADSADKMPTEN